MVSAIALCAAGIALVVSALCAWLTRNQAIAAQVLAKEASRLAEEATRVREFTVHTLGAQADALQQEARENRDALAIAERSARAAEESARATRMLAESGQRAYVGLGAMQVVRSDLSLGSPTAVRCEIRNTGKTPAFALCSAQWLRLLAELPAEPEYTGMETMPSSDLGPGSVQTSDTSLAPLDAHTTQLLRNREVTVFLYGISRYTDVFGMARQTHWAFYWNPEKRQFTRCAHHNDMT
jgi:hypothetical protein